MEIPRSSRAGFRASFARAFVVGSCSSLALACSEGTSPRPGEALEGTFEAIVVEAPPGAAELGGTLYRLRTDDGAEVELSFEEAPSVGSGARVTVYGDATGDRFHVTAFDAADGAGDPIGRLGEPLQRADRAREATIAFVGIDLNGGGVNRTESDIQSFMFSTTNPGPLHGLDSGERSVVQYYEEISFGLLRTSGDYEGVSHSYSGSCTRSIGSQVTQQFGGQLDYDHRIWYFGTRQSGCDYGWGSLGTWSSPRRDVWFNGGLFAGAITHEIGHNLGFQHASTIDCGNVPLADDPESCTTDEYGSRLSVMGNRFAGHMHGLEKWYAGWFAGCNGVRVRSSGTFALHPIERECAGGIQTLQVPMSTMSRTFSTEQSNGSNPARYYYLEYRTSTGLDTGLTPSVMVHVSDDVPQPNRVCPRNVQLDMTPSTSSIDGMTEGQSYMDPAGGLTFAVTSITSALATVTVTMSAAAMPNTCMDGTTLSGSGPMACTGGRGGTGGMGGIGGMGAMGGSGGLGGAAGAGNGGGPGAGSGGSPMAGTGGAPVAGSGGLATGGTGGSSGAAAGRASGGVPSTGGTAPAGAAGAAGTPSTGGGAGAGVTGGSAGSGPFVTPPGDTTDDAGCGCRVGTSSTRTSTTSLWSLAVVALLAARRRRASSVGPRRVQKS